MCKILVGAGKPKGKFQHPKPGFKKEAESAGYGFFNHLHRSKTPS